MKANTGWVSPPLSIGGLDHLGTQAPCVLVYSQLLPGITNVTDRARYYSFYTWLIWSIAQRFPAADADEFVEYYRRADCLFTLAAERHSQTTDRDSERHGVAMVGRVKLVPALDLLKKQTKLRLSTYSDRDSALRYFQNAMGGLAQYYAGTLAELNLLDSSSRPWVKYTVERGEPLAKIVDGAVPGDRFWKVIEQDEVALNDLDALSAFCPCQLTSSIAERQSLTDVFFDRRREYEQDGEQRCRSLALVLHLTSALRASKDVELTDDIFRGCVYSGALPGERNWEVPAALERTRRCWAIYQRNDLLSVAFQTLFSVCLRELHPQDASRRKTFASVESFVDDLVSGEEVVRSLRFLKASSFGQLVEKLAKSAPRITAWQRAGHEHALCAELLEGWENGADTGLLLSQTIQILALLAGRDDPETPAYGPLVISRDAILDYPINLETFRMRNSQWRELRLDACVAELAQWCLNTHLHVALRKMRQTGRSTFHFHPGEQGLVPAGDVPPPAHTTPRFRQSVQILRDIGALRRNTVRTDRPTYVSPEGRALLEAACV
jgi:hypothetical protein